jgi:hypothetical protein
MNFSKVAFKLRENIAHFSGELSKRLDKTAQRFIGEAIYGILYSQSVLLTDIGRSLETDVSMKKLEERFCRQLGKQEIWASIQESLLEEAGPKVKDDTLLILDIGDIQKKYAKKMQYLAEVRDGSEKVIGEGYWLCDVIGTTLDTDAIIPLYQTLYSQDSPDFKSENDEILKAISRVAEKLGNKGIWIIDRGGDRENIFKPFLNYNRRFIIRLVGTRNLIYKRHSINALILATICNCHYKETIVKEENGEEKVSEIEYGFMPVKLPFHNKKLYLLVIKGYCSKPIMILTTEPLKRKRIVLERVLKSYFKRWSIEETFRFLKQTYDIENIRVIRYNCLRNMMVLVLAVFYFLAVVLDGNQKLVIMSGFILKCAKRVFGIPDFKYYALGDGISNIFTRSPGRMVDIIYARSESQQVSLNFT